MAERYAIALLVCAHILALAGCASHQPAREVSGIDSEIFAGKWFDYYNRAMRRIASGEFRAAEEDLREAISLRPQESHRARVYGVRFQRYYPHRELGILALQSGDLGTAERELDLSLSQAATSKCKHFLNEVRRRRVREQNLDATPPSVSIESPPASHITNQRVVVIRGSVEDDTYVRELSVGNEPILIELAEPRVSFSSELSLSPGRNRVPIVATDLAGRRSVQEIEVDIDVDGPSLSLDTVRVIDDGETLNAMIRCTVLDSSGIADCRIGTKALESGGQRVVVDGLFPVGADDTGIPFLVHDRCGNESSGMIQLLDEQGRWRVGSLFPASGIRVACTDSQLALGLLLSAFPPRAPDLDEQLRQSPRYVFTSRYPLAGWIRDDHGVDSVSVNDIPVGINPGREVYLSHSPNLCEGTNPLCIRAEDTDSLVSSATVEMIYTPPSPLKHKNRMCIAYDFEATGGVSENELAVSLGYFQKAVAEDRRFQVVDRKSLPEIARERMIAAMLESPAYQLFGELQPAHVLLHAEAIEDRGGIQFFLKASSVLQPNEPLDTIDLYLPAERRHDLEQAMRDLYAKLLDAFPLACGKVADLDGGKGYVHTTLGERHRLRLGQALFVWRSDELSGYTMTEELPVLAYLRVTGFSIDESRARLVRKLRDARIEKGDNVITE